MQWGTCTFYNFKVEGSGEYFCSWFYSSSWKTIYNQHNKFTLKPWLTSKPISIPIDNFLIIYIHIDHSCILLNNQKRFPPSFNQRNFHFQSWAFIDWENDMFCTSNILSFMWEDMFSLTLKISLSLKKRHQLTHFLD